jgi:hypothetical protein
MSSFCSSAPVPLPGKIQMESEHEGRNLDGERPAIRDHLRRTAR